MNIDIGKKYTIHAGLNALHCWGLGVNYYTMFDLNTNMERLTTDARILRIDFLFFFINITRWSELYFEDLN